MDWSRDKADGLQVRADMSAVLHKEVVGQL